MSANPHIVDVTRSGMLNELGITDLGAAAIFVIYAGNQPTDANTAVTAGNTVVASLGWTTNAFTTTTTGILTAKAINADTSCAGGTGNWASVQKSTGLRVLDMSVGTAAADLIFPSITFATGATISVTSLTISLP